MARTRKSRDNAWIPPRTYRGRPAYEFNPKNGGTIRLCGPESTPAKVQSAYEALINDREDESLFEG